MQLFLHKGFIKDVWQGTKHTFGNFCCIDLRYHILSSFLRLDFFRFLGGNLNNFKNNVRYMIFIYIKV